MLISNHVSWLDILILGGSTGTAFVSKDNLGHGVIHWLADQNATLYVSREDRRGSQDQAVAIAARAERDQPITFFPEGTTGPGDELLPFRSSLLEAASLCLDRTSKFGRWRSTMARRPTEVGWHGESGKDNVLRDSRPQGHAAGDGAFASAARSHQRPQGVGPGAREAIAETLASSRGAAPL